MADPAAATGAGARDAASAWPAGRSATPDARGTGLPVVPRRASSRRPVLSAVARARSRRRAARDAAARGDFGATSREHRRYGGRHATGCHAGRGCPAASAPGRRHGAASNEAGDPASRSIPSLRAWHAGDRCTIPAAGAPGFHAGAWRGAHRISAPGGRGQRHPARSEVADRLCRYSRGAAVFRGDQPRGDQRRAGGTPRCAAG